MGDMALVLKILETVKPLKIRRGMRVENVDFDSIEYGNLDKARDCVRDYYETKCAMTALTAALNHTLDDELDKLKIAGRAKEEIKRRMLEVFEDGYTTMPDGTIVRSADRHLL